MTCVKCGSLDTEMSGEIRGRDGKFQWECNDCGLRYYRDGRNP